MSVAPRDQSEGGLPPGMPLSGELSTADRISDLLRGEPIGSEVIRSDEARRLANKLSRILGLSVLTWHRDDV